jgi:hypothetical protein
MSADLFITYIDTPGGPAGRPTYHEIEKSEGRSIGIQHHRAIGPDAACEKIRQIPERGACTELVGVRTDFR